MELEIHSPRGSWMHFTELRAGPACKEGSDPEGARQSAGNEQKEMPFLRERKELPYG